MFDRWLFDGFAPINAINAAIGRRNGNTAGGLLTVLAALLSPTAILHAFTGVTLLAGYAHVRSMDSFA